MRILSFGDLHISSIKDTNYIYNVITDIFEKELVFTKTDAVVILGDYFDRLLKANEDSTALAINIMSYLVRACKKNKIKIRLVYGTESHESGQYILFNYHLTEPELDFKIITTVTKEELFPGVNVLYLPEEYMLSKEDHYKDYLYSDNSYDYIFGHGVIAEGMPMLQFDTKPKSNEKHVPHFKTGELSEISKICLFNHYHCYSDLGNDVYYLGSLFRDSFGEETPKGYGIIENNNFTFIENKEAYVYKTYEFNEDSEVYKNSENLIKEIKRLKYENVEIFKGERFGKIRLKFNIPQNIDVTFKENIRSILFNDKHISLLMKESSTDIISEIQETIDEEYDFILDNSLVITDKIHQYINKKYDSDMSLEELTKYINEDFKIA
jgi:hypothetical protein